MRRKPLIDRRTFAASTSMLSATCLLGNQLVRAEPVESDKAITTRPFLTPADAFRDVSRGNPKPHTLKGDALVAARLTPDTWRLEITADEIVDPPHIEVPAKLSQQRTIADDNAIDLKTLIKLGEQHSVRYIKSMQCLNIDTPLGQGLWEGVPLRDVLRLCAPMENVRRIYYWGYHNNLPDQIFQSSLSYTQVMETAPGELPVFLAYRLNGEPLSLERGGPVRMVVPWAFGFKSIKWLQHIFVTNDYRANDTYALKNNDPESQLKTAAYVDKGPKTIPAGQSVLLLGQVISGLSGLDHVEYWVRAIDKDSKPLKDDSPELLAAPWKPCQLEPKPDWQAILPDGVLPNDLLGFDPQSGEPNSWPLRYGSATFHAEIEGLPPGTYEIRARSVDVNGFAQPEPRSLRKSGKNSIQVWKVKIVEA